MNHSILFLTIDLRTMTSSILSCEQLRLLFVGWCELYGRAFVHEITPADSVYNPN